MLKDKKALEQYLDEQCDRIVVDNNKCKNVYSYANETYNIPKGIILDFVSKRKSMSEATEFVLFILLDSIHNALKDDKKILDVDSFYTMQEAKFYKNSKYEVEKIEFPLTFKMIQVTNDQWVGTISVKELMQLRKAQLVNYNSTTQRGLKRIVKGEKELYHIAINKKAVKDITNALNNKTFISNALTFNIPMDTEYDFYYNEETHELIINKLEHWDCIDGFHRWLAICSAFDMDNNFEYSFEIRIVNWETSKCQTFIYQEAQHTPIKKAIASSLNMNKDANIIVERINNNVNCNMKGLISRNDGIINFADMAMLVDWFYIKNNKEKGSSNTLNLKIIRELTNNINILTESNNKYLEERWDYVLLLSSMCVFDYCKNNNIGLKDIDSLIDKVFTELKGSNNTKLKNKTIRKGLVEYVNEVIKNNL